MFTIMLYIENSINLFKSGDLKRTLALANNADPDQTLQNAASGQGLHCLYYIALDMFFFNPKALIFFLFLHESICCGNSLKAPR